LPLILSVKENPIFKFNAPPWFDDPADQQIDYELNENRSEYHFDFNLTEQFDDNEALAYMNISQQDFGQIRYKYIAYRDSVKLVWKDALDFMTFDPVTNLLRVSFDYGLQ